MSRNVPMEPVICGECGATLRYTSAPVFTPPDALREADWYRRESDGQLLYGHLMSKADIAATLAPTPPDAPECRHAMCQHGALIVGDDNCPDCGAPVIYRRLPADTSALWTDPHPRTPEGRRLLDIFVQRGPKDWGVRDLGQRICQIENEAATPERARLAGLVRGLPVIDGLPEYSFGDGQPVGNDAVRKSAVLALLEEPDAGVFDRNLLDEDPE